MPGLILYQRDECHLCDQAIALLAHVRAGDFEPFWIDGDPELEARYGLRVPVLSDAQGRELEWPFDAVRLRAWLDSA